METALTATERATLQFYQWEYCFRGYYHFDIPVQIEPPYIPFHSLKYSTHEVPTDNGRVPSLVSRLRTFISGKPKEPYCEDEFILDPYHIRYPKLIGLSLCLNKGSEISKAISSEFLNMLSFTDEPLSFEILASNDSIHIHMICAEHDEARVRSHLRAYFPAMLIENISPNDLPFDFNRDIAIVDFGLQDEFMRPINSAPSFNLDPLTSFIATLETLAPDDVALFQIIFKGVTSPWSKDILASVSNGRGGSFFVDSPEMLTCAKEKVSAPLFSVVMRIAVQGSTNKKSRYLSKELSRSITNISRSDYNRLIPLSNEGYEYDNHIWNVYQRASNRLGMILNTHELVTFLHYPNTNIASEKLYPLLQKTKMLPTEYRGNKYMLGVNIHNNTEYEVSIDDETFGRHIFIGGSTGTGKTHLLKQLIAQSFAHAGTFVIDPHGDLIHDILQTIPEERKDDVIYINIASEDYSFGFNIFSASHDTEKTVLASDLASAFADTWISSGDRIQSVLQKTIGTFVYAHKEASLLEMKRFLLEESFRNEFLKSLDDPVLLYYWHHEFPHIRRNELAPLLLRIDSFMQTRLLRNIFVQRNGIDFNALANERKLVLIQLSVGLIGLENSKFLAKLFIAKINQISFGRQNIEKGSRHPIHLYIDEANYYATTHSIEHILSGARKYNLSLILVLQHLEQMPPNILNAILTNTATQIYFRQSDKDSKRIASSFSFFEPIDFMELGTGEALVRINKRSHDFNMTTLPLNNHVPQLDIQKYIQNQSYKRYALGKDDVQKLLEELLPQPQYKKISPKREELPPPLEKPIVENIQVISDILPQSVSEEEKESFLAISDEQEQITKHRSIQNYIRAIAQQRGFKVSIEEKTDNGEYVDVALIKDEMNIAVEISVTNKIEYEVANIEKCLNANYQYVLLLSESPQHLKNIQKRSLKAISKKYHTKIAFMPPSGLSEYLDTLNIPTESETKRIRGYRVTSRHIEIPENMNQEKSESIKDIIINALKKTRKK